MKKSFFKVFSFIAYNILSLLSGVAIGLLFVVSKNDNFAFESYFINFMIFMVLVVISYIIQIIIHELGHLIFGILSGYKFVSFRIFSFMWIKKGDTINFKRYSLVGTAGQCLMSLPENTEDTPPVLLHNLGGGLMNFISACFFGTLWFIIPQIPIISIFLLLLTAMGLFNMLINCIPFDLGIIVNDGYNAFFLKKNEDAMHSFIIQLSVNKLISQDVSLKDMPEEWFIFPEEKTLQNSLSSVLATLCYNKLLVEHRFDEARIQMERLRGSDVNLMGIHSNLLINDLIYCELIGERRAVKVMELLTPKQKKAMRSMATNISVIRTEYTYALLYETDEKKAEIIKKRFEKIASKYPYLGEIADERELMDIAYSCFKS